jgi:hypothetical protein
MDSLTAPPVADVLARLFDEARETDGPLDERFAEVASDEKALADFLALEAQDYKGMYQQLAGYYLSSGSSSTSVHGPVGPPASWSSARLSASRRSTSRLPCVMAAAAN